MQPNTLPKGLGFCDYYYNGKKYTAHRTRLKIIVNPILRVLQFWSNTPYVIASNVVIERKKFLGYTLRRVAYK